VGKDIKLLDYINSLTWLTPQQKSKIAASATTMEDVSIMLKEMPPAPSSGDLKNSSFITSGTPNQGGEFNNSVWQNKTNSDSDGFTSTVSPSSVVTKATPESNNEVAKLNFFADTNFTADSPSRDAMRSSEKQYYKNGALKEQTEKEPNEKGKLVKERITEYDDKGKINAVKFTEYSDNERLILRETSEIYDRNEMLLSKKSVDYKYDSKERMIEETGHNYDENGKPVKSFVTKNEPNVNGKMVKAQTDKYDMDGKQVSSEVFKSEFVAKENVYRATDIVYDKEGKISKKIIDDTYGNEKGKKTKTDWKYYQKDDLVCQQVKEMDKEGLEAKGIVQNYEKNSITDRTVDESDKFQTSTAEYFDQGKINTKKTIQNLYDDKGNSIKETAVIHDAEGKFLAKQIISRNFVADKNDPYATDFEAGIVVANYNEKNKLINKTVNAIQRDSEGLRTLATANTYDSKGILTAKVVTKYKIEKGLDKENSGLNFPIAQTKTNYSEGKIISTETLAPSGVAGEYNYKSTDSKGNISNFIDVQKSPSGVNIVKKFKSPDGTKTDYQYSEDKNGNKKLLYKIIDKDGKELMSTERDYQKVSDNLSISKVDGKEYKIEVENDKITVFDVGNKKSTQIDLNKLANPKDSGLKNMLKTLPGDVLIGLSKELKKIGTDVNNGGYSRNDAEYITSDDKPSTICHEYGHSVDAAPNEANEIVWNISDNEDFKKIFSKEQENFKNSSTEADKEAFSYLDDLREFVAETKMVTTTKNYKDHNAMRGIELMKNFPKSIAVATKLLEETESSQKPRRVQ